VRFFVLLVEKFAEIGDLAHRRHSIRGNFDEIEPRIARRLHGVEIRQDAKLVAFFINHAHFTRADAFIYPRSKTTLGDKPTSR
jgi:hypothetical protein